MPSSIVRAIRNLTMPNTNRCKPERSATGTGSRILVFVLGILMLTGCKSIEFSDGIVPIEANKMIQPLLGTYVGKFNGRSGKLTIQMDSQNRPYLTFLSNKGSSDLFTDSCKTSVGHIEKAELGGSKKNPQVKVVYFEFDPGTCSSGIKGRQLRIAIQTENSKVDLELEIYRDTVMAPDPTCDGDFVHCFGKDVPTNTYYTGFFYK
jgi:hypothetical protein